MGSGEAGLVEPGDLAGGRYRLVKFLGRGGMGEVWAAEDTVLRRPVAIKILLASYGADLELAARLRIEAQAAAGLRHPGITVVHDFGDHEGRPYLVMELLDGDDLASVLAGHPGGLGVAEALRLMAEVAGALAHAHDKGVVHRDIKPANLMRLSDGSVKICDFGIARVADATRLTVSGGVLGTPAFMAPELFEGRPADARTDLYSLGATLFTLLTGRPPFAGGPLAVVIHRHLSERPPRLGELRPDAPGSLDVLVRDLLAKDRAGRPASARQVHDLLRSIAGSGRAAARPPVAPPEPGPASRHEPRNRHDGSAHHPTPATGTIVKQATRTATPDFPLSLTSSRPRPARPTVASPAAMPAQAPAPRRWSRRRFLVLSTLATVSGAGVPAGMYLARKASPEPSATLIATLSDPTGPVGCLAFSPDGKTLATSGELTIRLWDVTTWLTAATLTVPPGTGTVTSIAFSPDGRTLASGIEGDNPVLLWDLATHRTTATLDPTGYIDSLSFSPDGKTLALGHGDIRLWDLASHRVTAIITDPNGGGSPVAFSPDGKSVASVGSGTAYMNTIRFWDLATRKTTDILVDPTNSVDSLSFSPDGKTLATSNGTIELWNIATRQITATISEPLHNAVVSAVAFSPDGKTLASATGNDTQNRVRLWRLAGRAAALRALSWAEARGVVDLVFLRDMRA